MPKPKPDIMKHVRKLEDDAEALIELIDKHAGHDADLGVLKMKLQDVLLAVYEIEEKPAAGSSPFMASV